MPVLTQSKLDAIQSSCMQERRLKHKHQVFTVLLLAASLQACGGGSSSSSSSPPVTSVPQDKLDGMNPSLWEIGPIINGKNYSVGAQARPTQTPDGWSIDFPNATEGGSIHYVTMPSVPLDNYERIHIKYRIEANPGVILYATSDPNAPSMLVLYFQRADDNWSGTAKYESYRWWASFRIQSPLVPGEYEVFAPFDQVWTAVQSSSTVTNWNEFLEARKNAGRIGFTLGGGSGLGHGVSASGPARIVVTHFGVE